MIKEIALAGLLHDIGKFYQKAKSSLDNTGKHPKVSKNFIKKYYDFFKKYVDVDILIELASRHHEQSFDEEFLCGKSENEDINPYTWLISTADNLSSSERDEESEEFKHYKTAPLNCVFNRISTNTKEDTTLYSYKSQRYSVSNIFPQKEDIGSKENNKYEREVLIENFTKEMDLLVNNPPKDFYHLMIVLDRFLKAYLWCIPASVKDRISDISLYDHLKTTSAIATSLYLYQEHINKVNKNNMQNELNKFFLLTISFCDIDKYIGSVACEGGKGISKRLRAKSFMIDIMLENICLEILSTLKLTIQNKLLLIGGKCHILLPNIDEYKEKSLNILKKTEQSIFNKYHGNLHISYCYTQMNKRSFSNYGQTLSDVSDELNKKSLMPFESVFINNKKWCTQKFILENSLKNTALCSECGKPLVEEMGDVCSLCKNYKDIGTKLPKTNYIAFNLDGNITFEEELLNVSSNYIIHTKNTLKDEFKSLPIETKYIANYTLTDCEGGICTFEEIAKASNECEKLALIKIEVDNLLYIFKEGFKKEDKDFASISRISTMSRMLDMFFTEYVNEILRTKYENSYCIYAGGNGLSVVIGFDKACEFTIDIYNKFNEFVGGNTSEFTMSSAIICFGAKTNLAIVINECNEHLNRVKVDNKDIYFMGNIFSLKNFKILFNSQYKIIKKEIDNENIDINILRRIQRYSEMYVQFLKKKDVMSLMFEPLFTRDIERNYKLEKTSKEFENYINKISTNNADYNNRNSNLYYAHIVVKYVLQITKDGRKNDNEKERKNG